MKVKYATIVVRDMDESIDFYTEVMGFEMDGQFKPAPGVVITLLRGRGDAMVELIKNTVDGVGLHSVGMEVEDVRAAVAGLEAKGARITMEPVPTLVGSLAFIEDPNGVKIALVEHH
jgi:lactoylglutathione lyase